MYQSTKPTNSAKGIHKRFIANGDFTLSQLAINRNYTQNPLLSGWEVGGAFALKPAPGAESYTIWGLSKYPRG
jgi:hypothetical protein